jgi:hypothetical protein
MNDLANLEIQCLIMLLSFMTRRIGRKASVTVCTRRL